MVPHNSVDYLLLATPGPATRARLQAEFDSTSVVYMDDPLGLKVPAIGKWQDVLETVNLILSAAERKDTRVAIIPKTNDPHILQKSLLQSKNVEETVQQIHEGWLYEVLESDGIQIHLQPLIQYPPGRLHGYECLMRGVDRDGKLISPGRMFGAARRLDILYLLDQRSRMKAVKHCASLHLPNIQFFINFLPTAIYDAEHCLRSTLEQVRSAGLRPDQIVFEVVETESTEDLKHLTDVLRRYREHGFKIAMDDVGAGYSSLLSLSQLRPDYIKLDAELVRRALRGSLEEKMVRDLAETARQHGIITVAEGVETDDQLRSILSLGIRLTQGYIHARPNPKPLSTEQVDAILKRLNACAEPIAA